MVVNMTDGNLLSKFLKTENGGMKTSHCSILMVARRLSIQLTTLTAVTREGTELEIVHTAH
jgi:hypothetical protein